MRAHHFVQAIACLALAGACKVDGAILNQAPGVGGRGGGDGQPGSTDGGLPGAAGTSAAGRGGSAGTGIAGAAGTGIAGSAAGSGGSAQGAGGSSAGGGGQAAGTGGSSAGSPDAGTVAADRRYLFIFYTAHGTVLDAWRPSGATGNLTLSPILQPLEPYKDVLTVVDGLDNVSQPGHVTSTHVDGPQALLTARAQGGPSIDYLFDSRSAVGLINYKHTGVVSTNADWIRIVPSGQPIIGALSPLTLENDLFADSGLPLPIPNPPNNTGTGNTYGDAGGNALDSSVFAPIFGQILAGAFSADLRRSATLMWNIVDEQSPVAGSSLVYKALAEASATSPAREQFVTVQTEFAQSLASLVALFRSTALDPTTSLLDRSLILWISETGEASSESGHSIPVVLIGNLGGALRQGQYLHYSGRTQADLMQTLAKAAGQTAFGDPALSTGVLTELLAP